MKQKICSLSIALAVAFCFSRNVVAQSIGIFDGQTDVGVVKHKGTATYDAKSQEYEARLRAARAEIFRHREQLMHQWNAEREQALASARLAAQERIRAAEAALKQQTVDARAMLEGSTEQLAAQILQAILPQSAPVEGVR